MKKSILLNLLMFTLGSTVLVSAKAQDDLIYVAVEPCRIVDTRNAGGAISADTFRNFRVSGTVGELAVQGGESDCLDPKAATGLKPSAISAYILAVPATSSTGGGVLTAYPSDQLPPPVGTGSTVNFAPGQIIGNTTNIILCDEATLRLPPSSCPTDGEFAVLARSTDEDVVVDVQGYFYPMTKGGVDGWEKITQTVTPGAIGTIGGAILSCSSGKKVFGGGYVSADGVKVIDVFRNGPDSTADSDWRFSYMVERATNGTVTFSLICANVATP